MKTRGLAEGLEVEINGRVVAPPQKIKIKGAGSKLLISGDANQLALRSGANRVRVRTSQVEGVAFLWALLALALLVVTWRRLPASYTAFSAGLVVGPRGIGSFIGSPIIGFLGSRIDPRKLLSVGFIGFGICSLIFGTVNLNIGPTTLLWPIVLTGFALSFVFVPLATMSTSTVPRRRATGLTLAFPTR